MALGWTLTVILCLLQDYEEEAQPSPSFRARRTKKRGKGPSQTFASEILREHYCLASFLTFYRNVLWAEALSFAFAASCLSLITLPQ